MKIMLLFSTSIRFSFHFYHLNVRYQFCYDSKNVFDVRMTKVAFKCLFFEYIIWLCFQGMTGGEDPTKYFSITPGLEGSLMPSDRPTNITLSFFTKKEFEVKSAPIIQCKVSHSKLNSSRSVLTNSLTIWLESPLFNCFLVITTWLSHFGWGRRIFNKQKPFLKKKIFQDFLFQSESNTHSSL